MAKFLLVLFALIATAFAIGEDLIREERSAYGVNGYPPYNGDNPGYNFAVGARPYPYQLPGGTFNPGYGQNGFGNNGYGPNYNTYQPY